MATEETVARVVEFTVMKLGQGQWQETGSRLLSVYTFAPATASARILAYSCVYVIFTARLLMRANLTGYYATFFSCCSRIRKV